jgi:hypothetical protein
MLEILMANLKNPIKNTIFYIKNKKTKPLPALLERRKANFDRLLVIMKKK